MADVMDGVGRQHKALGAAHVEKPGAALVDLQTVRLEAGPLVRVGGIEHACPIGAIEGLGQQDTGLLEALAQGSHPEGQPAGVDAQELTRLAVRSAPAQIICGVAPIGGIHRPPREDVGTGHELAGEVASEHADLDCRSALVVVGIPDQHHRRGISQSYGHRCTLPPASPPGLIDREG